MTRRERVASVLAREISNIVTQEMRDPRLGLITITDVVVSPDLKVAVVFFSSLQDKSGSLEVLSKAKGYIKSILANRVIMKSIPDLKFEIDDSFEHGKRIDELFGKINKADKEE